jgi:hypothetical protein
MAFRTEAFKTKIKAELSRLWALNGFNQEDNSWVRYGRNRETRFTFEENQIIRFIREYPASEGWSRDKFTYSKKTLDRLKDGLAW